MPITNGVVDLPTIKARLNLADSQDDDLLIAIVNAVSRQIEDYTNHRFYATTQTRVYTASLPTCLMLPPGHDLLSVSTLKSDEDGDRTYEVTWATSDYDLGPANNPLLGLPYWELQVRYLGNYAFPAGIPLGVQIVGSWGYSSTTPSVVQEAGALQIQLWFQQSKASGNPALGTGEYAQTLTGIGLHPFVRRMLDPMRTIAAT